MPRGRLRENFHVILIVSRTGATIKLIVFVNNRGCRHRRSRAPVRSFHSRICFILFPTEIETDCVLRIVCKSNVTGPGGDTCSRCVARLLLSGSSFRRPLSLRYQKLSPHSLIFHSRLPNGYRRMSRNTSLLDALNIIAVPQLKSPLGN